MRIGALLLLAVLTAAAQTTVEGDVVNSVGSQPIVGAQVRAQCANDEPVFTMTDEHGQFHFAGLPNCRFYSLQARFPGMLRQDRPVITQGAPLHIALTPAAAISGKVTDADGAPAQSAAVRLMMPIDPNAPRPSGAYTREGGTQYFLPANAMTNDLGEYRLSSVPAGAYFLDVRPSGLGGPAVRGTFYPHTLEISAAKTIEVTAGRQIAGLDLQLIQQAGVTVSGRVILPTDMTANARTRPMLTFRNLMPGQTAIPVVHLGPGDRFEVRDLLPGKYTVDAQLRETSDVRGLHPLATARLPVEIGGRNIDDLEIRLAAPPRIEGALSFAPGCTAIPVVLRLATDPMQGLAQEVQPAPDGSIDSTLPYPGKYQITVWERGDGYITALSGKGYSASIRIGGSEVPAEGFDAVDEAKASLRIQIDCPGGRR